MLSQGPVDQAEALPEEGIWAWMLQDTLARSAPRRPQKHLVLIGSKSSGKASLEARFRGQDVREVDSQKGLVLDYAHTEVPVADALDGSETARLSLWRLDSEIALQPFLQFALSRENIGDAVVMITLDMSRPWTLMDELEAWAKVLGQHIESLGLDPNDMQTLRDQLTDFFQRYQEPVAEGTEPDAGSASRGRDADVLLPLEKGTLAVNLGVPIIVVCNKCDRTDGNEALRDEQYDFIQCRLRKFCLKYGAALVYASARSDKNCRLVFDYALHRLYGSPFSAPASVVDKDGVFVPTGWDRDSKIAIVSGTLRSLHPDDPYDDAIKPPAVRKRNVEEPEVEARDEQAFLAELARRLEVGGAAEPAQPAEPRPLTPTQQQKPAAAKSDDMAMAFFNSLLQSRGGPSAKKGTPGRAAAGSPSNEPGSPRAARRTQPQGSASPAP